MESASPTTGLNPWAIGPVSLNPESARAFATAAFIVLLVVLIRAPYLGDPAADPDEQLYSLMGQAWLQGDMPYRDLWDRKPPGLFALFAGMHWIGGSSPLAYQIPALACTAASALMIHRIAQRMGTPLGAMVVTAVFLLSVPRFFMHLGQSETFLAPILLAQLIGIRRAFDLDNLRSVYRLFCALMLLGGIALQIKYSVLPFCALLAAVAAFRIWQLDPHPLRTVARLVIFGVLGLLPTLTFAAYFGAHGEFEAFFFANFVSIFLRGEFYPLLAETNATRLTTSAFPLVAYAVLGVFTASRMRHEIDLKMFLLTGSFTAAGAITLLMLGSPFVHYFGLVLPFLCLMGASFFSHHASRTLFSTVALALALLSASFPEQITHTTSHRTAIASLVADIERHVPADECIYVFDGPSIVYSQSNRCIPTRLPFPPHLNSPHEQHALDVNPARETARILGERPGAILVSTQLNTPQFLHTTRDQVREALNADYTLVQSIEFYPRELELYVRGDLTGIEDSPRQALR